MKSYLCLLVLPGIVSTSSACISFVKTGMFCLNLYVVIIFLREIQFFYFLKEQK